MARAASGMAAGAATGAATTGARVRASSEPTDGRARRGVRNREAIIDALLACYHDGMLRPSAAEVAARAGVSARSVHNHFDDMESLVVEVARRQQARFNPYMRALAPTGPVRERTEALVALRAALFEGVAPVRRAALLAVHESPAIAANLARADRALRRQIEHTFAPEIETGPAHLLHALDVLLSWDAWNHLRHAQRCSAARARRVLTDTIAGIIEGTTT